MPQAGQAMVELATFGKTEASESLEHGMAR